ncbi:hypothetical protein N1030_11525 [Desulfovibrio mangrovi]|uniref:hypothetical protein n=1 Tax=Desulfovibrio mangrovi TaxID=2976983 RepID=UPI002247E706|nr:hypothetical protein [Desulfovibrio mangrovi]UZP66250.1 hypothetical protein N1030_11525 [Desulfovibrio mangrovi]
MLDLFLPLAFMLSPGALVAVGNGSGLTGMLFSLFLLVAMLCALTTVNGMGAVQDGNKAHKLFRAYGLGVINAARILALVTLGTLWLSEAGYSFNELFASWYPNLAFSFTLLALIAAGSLMALTPRGVILYIATLIALAAVGYIGAMATQPHGMEGLFPTMFPQRTPPFFPTGGDPLKGAYLALLALLGFDLASRPDAGKGAQRALMALMIAVCVFVVYQWGSLSSADPLDLSSSTVPHILMAGIALGDKGRQIMGIAVVFGTFSAILSLLIATTRQLQFVLRKPDNDVLRRQLHVLLCLSIAALLAFGWAGEPRLENLINAALLCWFAGYLLINLSLLLKGQTPPLAILGMLVYLFASWMTFSRSDDLELLAYTTGAIAFAGFVFAFGYAKSPTQTEPPKGAAPQAENKQADA